MAISDYIPAAGTFSKDSKFWGGQFPFRYVTSGSGSRVKGNNGRDYLDWVSGLGACLLGYAPVGFTSYVDLWAKRGNGFSFPHELEYLVAEKLCIMLGQRVSNWVNVPLQVRWVKTGTDACSAAIRLARAATGKMHILSQGYHGWSDDFVSMTPPAWGIISEQSGYMHTIDSTDVHSLDKYEERDDIAAVIVEHPATKVADDWYEALRRFCDARQALLIMDEVVTGLRYGLGGASERYGVQPNLICTGKALGNGYPLGALIGPRGYMRWFGRNDPVFVSSTNAGDTASLAAANYVLDSWHDKQVEQIWRIGQELQEGLDKIGLSVIGHPPRSLLLWKDEYRKAYFILGMATRGVLMNRPNFPTLAHTEADVRETLNAAREVAGELANLSDEDLRAKIAEKDLPVVLFRNR